MIFPAFSPCTGTWRVGHLLGVRSQTTPENLRVKRPSKGAPELNLLETCMSEEIFVATDVRAGPHTHRRISWAAIFGGVMLVIVVQLLLSTLGAGIGLGTVNVNGGTTPTATSLSVGAGVWWVVTSCIALFVGGFVAAWLAGIEIRFDGVLHGLVTWAISTFLILYLLTSAIGGIIGGGFSALGGFASAAGSGISTATKPLAEAAGLTPDTLVNQVKAFLQPLSPDLATMTPQDAEQQIAKDLVTYARGGADAAPAKERIVNIMAAQMKISHDEAAKQFDAAQARLQQAKEQAVQTAKNAADDSAAAVSKTSFAAFGVLLLGGMAAAFGGSLAVQRRLHPMLWMR
jgi:hypothetical protein